MTQGFSADKARVFNQLIQDGLSEDAALAQAGISGADVGNYELNQEGQLGPIVIGFEKQPGVNNATNNAEAQAFVSSVNDAGPVNFNDSGPANFNDTGVSASSVRSANSTTTSTNGGGVTIRVANEGTPTPESIAFQTQQNATYSDIKSISRQLGAPQFGGNPNLTQEERNALQAQRAALYQQYNQEGVASTNALAPSAPAGSVTVPNTTTDTETTEFTTASFNNPISGADDQQLQQQEIASTQAPVPESELVLEPTAPGEDDLVLLNTGENLGAADAEGFVVDPATGLNILPEEVPVGETDNQLVNLNTGENLTVDQFGFAESNTGLNVLPEDQPAGEIDGYLTELTPEGDQVFNPEEAGIVQEQASAEFNARQRARQQQSISSQRKQVNNGDWRVRLRLAPQSKYLYKAPQPGILQPLDVTDGVIFPYTPTITTNYRANYTPYDLTHSNYKGYWYSSSAVEPITITGMFTAQDTAEANYLLAVIHFFRSATKMFYGQDAERGAPPPVCYLSGHGEYQFNEHSCLIQNFNYTLPADVDYVRAGSPGNTGVNLTTRRDRQTVATNGIFGSLNRLAAAFLTKGAIPGPPAPPTLGLNRPTYVPTRMEITIQLLPIQSRQQVSTQFSVKEFANGNLLRGGFW